LSHSITLPLSHSGSPLSETFCLRVYFDDIFVDKSRIKKLSEKFSAEMKLHKMNTRRRGEPSVGVGVAFFILRSFRGFNIY
jgi:hypothetical protein